MPYDGLPLIYDYYPEDGTSRVATGASGLLPVPGNLDTSSSHIHGATYAVVYVRVGEQYSVYVGRVPYDEGPAHLDEPSNLGVDE